MPSSAHYTAKMAEDTRVQGVQMARTSRCLNSWKLEAGNVRFVAAGCGALEGSQCTTACQIVQYQQVQTATALHVTSPARCHCSDVLKRTAHLAMLQGTLQCLPCAVLQGQKRFQLHSCAKHVQSVASH
eukprot:scpid107376/ scgid23570/ 